MNSMESIVRRVKKVTGLTSRSPLVASFRPAYDFMLTTLYGRRGLVRVVNEDEQIYVRPLHRYAHEDYEPEVYKRIKSLVKPGAVVLDIGAHIGLFTILLARWAGTTGRVFAFEPTPITRAALFDHLTLNDIADRVEVIGKAVSDIVGTTVFHAATNSPENTLNAKHSRLGEAEVLKVPVTTIDAFCAKRNLKPTLIKMDIEGFEFHALRGAKEVLARSRPQVIVEMHPMNWPEIGITRERATAILKDLKCRAVPLEGQTDPLGEYGHVILEHIS